MQKNKLQKGGWINGKQGKYNRALVGDAHKIDDMLAELNE